MADFHRPRSEIVSLRIRDSGWSFGLKPWRRLLPRRPIWGTKILLGQEFFGEITSSAVPVDLRAIRQLRRSPLAIDLYDWLTYRMSCLKKPTLIPWQALQVQFGSDYSRLRDFRSHAVTQLQKAFRVYPAVRVSQTHTGLRLCPSPPHIQRLEGSAHSGVQRNAQNASVR